MAIPVNPYPNTFEFKGILQGFILILVSLSIPTFKNGDRPPYIFGAKLHDEYELEGLHFHWGDRNNRGSEHVLNDIRFPMEMHIIHRNTKYATAAEAYEHYDGLTVLAFFYNVSFNFEKFADDLIVLLTLTDLFFNINKCIWKIHQ